MSVVWLSLERSIELKPPYAVPTMKQIRAVKENGFSVASTFSGCGGSSLGYQMVGFRVVWANEFVPAAAEVYRLNHPKTFLNTSDIRVIDGDQILRESGRAEIDVLDGSPPCASFSTAGKGSKLWGKVKQYSDTAQRVDDLFYEYVRVLAQLKPKVFVAENVSGLVKGKAKGFFLRILDAMKDAGYTVRAQLLNAQWLGVPQSRERLFFIGVRSDLQIDPIFPKPLPYFYSIADAIPAVRKVWYDRTTATLGAGAGRRISRDRNRPAPTITAHGATTDAREDWLVEIESSMERFATGSEWKNLRVGEQSEKYFQLVRSRPDKPVGTITAGGGNACLASVSHPYECRKFSIAELRRLSGFPDDFVLTGSYAKQWERIGRAVPPVMMSHVARAVQEVLCQIK